MVAVNRLFGNSKTLHYAATPLFDGLCNSILLQYNENGEKHIFIFREPPTFIFLCIILWDLYLLGTLYTSICKILHCTVVIEVIFLFRVARDVSYPLVQDYPKTSQNILIEK